MDNEIKKRIEELKKDKSTLKQYINSFCSISKSQELFKNNRDFKNLKSYIDNKDYSIKD